MELSRNGTYCLLIESSSIAGNLFLTNAETIYGTAIYSIKRSNNAEIGKIISLNGPLAVEIIIPCNNINVMG